ncbi:multi-copper oxidase laccase-like protein [Melampsora americana]|nr:multi-copper oxidase laccase-like protein [Melampsora americana]
MDNKLFSYRSLASFLCLSALLFIKEHVATVKFNSPELYSLGDFNISSTPQTRDYTFIVTNETAAPDGFTRNVLVINSQIPGPLIEANESDTLNIHVENKMAGTLSIHWHGLLSRLMIESLYQGVTQCPIPAGQSFTYTFTIKEQFGTFWYHAHSQNYMIDGISGPLIVHSPNDPLKKGQDFEQDVILMMADWHHDMSDDILRQQLSTGYNGSQAAPSPARLRLINGGAHAMFRVSADEHTLAVVEADSTGVRAPQGFHRVPFLAPGINETAGTGRAIVRVVNSTVPEGINNTAFSIPTTLDWNDTISGPCVDLDPSTLTPLISKAACTDVIGRVFFESSVGFIIDNSTGVPQSEGRFFIRNTTWLTFPFQPVLYDLISGGSGAIDQTEVAAFTMDKVGCYDLVINNLDAGIDHPYHLHGVDRYVVATGQGRLTPEAAETLTYNLTNPLRRDTEVVPGGQYAVYRLVADNPGVWILHCHIGWHLGAGFAGVIVMQPDVLAQRVLPTSNGALCNTVTPETVNTTEPGRRKRSIAQQHAYKIYSPRSSSSSKASLRI